MIIKPFSAFLTRAIDADAGALPLSEADENRLKSLVPESEEILLTLKDDLHVEYVKITNTCDALLLERGLSGTVARKFPRGTCVFFENSIAVTQWLICNFNCCDGPCPCEEVEAAGVVFPEGQVNVPYTATAIFKGSLPMVLGVSGHPSWSTAEMGANYIKISGTPTGAGTYAVNISATNCSGSALSMQSAQIVIT